MPHYKPRRGHPRVPNPPPPLPPDPSGRERYNLRTRSPTTRTPASEPRHLQQPLPASVPAQEAMPNLFLQPGQPAPPYLPGAPSNLPPHAYPRPLSPTIIRPPFSQPQLQNDLPPFNAAAVANPFAQNHRIGLDPDHPDGNTGYVIPNIWPIPNPQRNPFSRAQGHSQIPGPSAPPQNATAALAAAAAADQAPNPFSVARAEVRNPVFPSLLDQATVGAPAPNLNPFSLAQAQAQAQASPRRPIIPIIPRPFAQPSDPVQHQPGPRSPIPGVPNVDPLPSNLFPTAAAAVRAHPTGYIEETKDAGSGPARGRGRGRAARGQSAPLLTRRHRGDEGAGVGQGREAEGEAREGHVTPGETPAPVLADDDNEQEARENRAGVGPGGAAVPQTRLPTRAHPRNRSRDRSPGPVAQNPRNLPNIPRDHSFYRSPSLDSSCTSHRDPRSPSSLRLATLSQQIVDTEAEVADMVNDLAAVRRGETLQTPGVKGMVKREVVSLLEGRIREERGAIERLKRDVKDLGEEATRAERERTQGRRKRDRERGPNRSRKERERREEPVADRTRARARTGAGARTGRS